MLTKPGILSAEDIFIGDIPLNTIDNNSVAWMVTDLEGWWGLPDVEIPDDARPFSQDGSYYTTGRFTSRTINLKGYILPVDGKGDKAVSARNAFNRALVLVRERASLKVREEGTVKTSLVQISSRPLLRISRSTGLLEFDISLKATDPVKYGDYVNTLNMYLSSSNTGRVYDRFFNFSYGGASIEEILDFFQGGSYWSYPEMTITGPIVDPMVSVADGRFLRFKTTLGPGEELKIVNFTEEVSKGGQNVINTLTKDSRWFNFLPGENQLRFRGTQHIPSREHLSIQTNFAYNPVPLGTGVGTTAATAFRENTVRNPEGSGAASSQTVANMGVFVPGTGGAGTTMTSDTPVDVTIRTNLSRNPSIETNTTGYVGNGATVTREGGWADSGEYSLKAAPTSTTSSGTYVRMGIDSTNVDTAGGMTFFEAGKTYTASCTLRVPYAQVGPLDGAARTLVFYSQIGSNGYVSQTQAASTAPNSPGTYRISNTFTVPVSATQAFIRPVIGSRAYTVTNYNNNPSVETNLTGYTAQANSGFTLSRTSTAVANPIKVGTNVLRITTQGVTSTGAYVVKQDAVAPAAGEWLGAGINMRRSSGATHAKITLEMYNADLSVQTPFNSPIFELFGGNGSRHTIVAQVPATPAVAFARVVVRLYQNSAGTVPAADGAVDTDAWSLVRSTTQSDAQWQAENYFDGATADLNGWNYVWTGTAHASTSTGTHDQSLYYDAFLIEEKPTLGTYFDGTTPTIEDPVLVDTEIENSWTGTSHASTSVQRLSLFMDEGGPVDQGGPFKFVRHLITQTKTSASSGFHSETSTLRANIAGVSGDDLFASGWVRYSGPATADANHRVRLRLQPALAAAIAGANFITDYIVLPHNEWVRIAVGGTATATFDQAQFYVIIDSGNAMPAYSTLDVAGFSIEKGKLQANYVKNPSFETGLHNYTATNVGLAQSDTWSETGTYSLEVTPTGSSSDSYASLSSPDTGLVNGRIYRVSGTVHKFEPKVGTLSTYADRISVRWSGGEANTPALPPESGTYRVSVTFTKPSALTSFRLYAGSNNAADKVYWDDIAIQEVSALQPAEFFEVDEDNYDKFYFDGDSVDASTHQVVWAGTRGNSVSYKVPSFFSGATPGLSYRNAKASWTGSANASNSVLKLNTLGWDAEDTSMYLTNEDPNRTRRPGTQSVSVKRLDVLQDNMSIAKLTNIGASVSGHANQPAITGLSRVAASVYCYTDYEHASGILTMEYLASGGAVLSTVSTPSPIPLSAGTWTRLVVDDPASRNASAVRVRVTAEVVSTDVGTNSHIGQTIYFQDAKIGLADYALEPYFDGSFQYAQWNGTAQNSSSTVPSEVTEILPASLEVRIRDAWIE